MMEDGECSLTFEKVTNPNIIKTTTKSSRVKLTHQIKSDCTANYEQKKQMCN